MKKYYLTISNRIFSADDYELIIQKVMYFSKFYLCDNEEKTNKFLNEWHRNGGCGGTLISKVREKFINFSISTHNPIIDLDERKKQEEKRKGE